MEFFQCIVISVGFKIWVCSLNLDWLVKFAHAEGLPVKRACACAADLLGALPLVGREGSLAAPTLKAPQVEQEVVCL